MGGSSSSKMAHNYEVNIYRSREDDVFVADVPELPGCVAHGETHDAALANINEAVELWVETAREFGDGIPVGRGGF